MSTIQNAVKRQEAQQTKAELEKAEQEQEEAANLVADAKWLALLASPFLAVPFVGLVPVLSVCAAITGVAVAVPVTVGFCREMRRKPADKSEHRTRHN